ncbi:Multifunctional conjugation protein TraI [Rubripirellula lacrimiformis]|uniref:Multifunctional conjugation protein TraI n=1 Tax=Rubripirellula lacrimiformis TaxID=1930273 RepID=A0A517NK06_9BACT|nr:MobF family relaxase [Rubripirellula lacrimiformis]QDT07450.1 Multifunctional conjugation protein TraI [Rubripirellula lacrimiformis]
MLIATQGKSVSSTVQYFDQVLTQGDYYLGQEVNGQWHGKGADALGLGRGTDVTKQQFSDLLQGKHPIDGTALAQRNRSDRRPGMDLTFSVPKSVSLAWAINEDERVVDALRAAVHETMTRDVEPLMQRRVRGGKHANSEQKTTTGKLIYADFLHKTSRPVKGEADPHLHIHAFVINWTQDKGRHYAGQMEEIVRQRPSLQAKFESRLARKLQNDLGYAVRRTRFAQSGRTKAGWEIVGIDRSTIEKFSRRTAQVEKHALEKGVSNATEKSKLGKLTREKKDKGATVETLRDRWQQRLTPAERKAFAALRGGKARSNGEPEQTRANASVKHSLDHHLYRQSTVERHQVVGTALEHGLTLTPEQIEQAVDRAGLIERSTDENGAKRHRVTTKEVLAAEKKMIDFARDGRGTRKAIGKDAHSFKREWLNDQQRSAVTHVIESRDTVMAVTGGAGTGKSSLMQEAAEAIRGNGKQVFAFAPSTGAKEVLQTKGFDNAQTVEHLIRNTDLHSKVENQVLWIDEAGLMDVRSMNAVFKIAEERNARVVLSGDTRQHASPRRGEAMRLLEKESGLNVARVEAIQRQKGQYKAAVEMISHGHAVIDPQTGKTGLLAGFDRLDAMGKIKEISHDERHQKLAEAYLSAESSGKSTLIVAPTHAEARAVTDEIRGSLRSEGKLATEEQTITQLRSQNLTDAEKGEALTYSAHVGSIVQFHQNAKGGFKKGERFRVAGAIGDEVRVESLDDGSAKNLPLDATERFDVYSQRDVSMAAGDKIRFTAGGTAQDGKKRISNGRLDELKGFDRNGNLILKGGTVVDQSYGHVDFGYVVTSHASQGKDRHIAIAAMGSESLPAINAKQFYVTVSRGSEDVAIYVDDKAKVRRAIARSGEQLSATEMIRSDTQEQTRPELRDRMHEYFHQGRRAVQSFQDRLSTWWNDQSKNRETNQVGPGTGLRGGFGMTPDLGRSR